MRQLIRQIVLGRLDEEQLARITADFDGSVQSTTGHAEGTAIGFNKKKGVKHPSWDLAVVSLVIVVHTATEDALLASSFATNDNLLAVEWMPRIVHPANLGFVITLTGGCTMVTELMRRLVATCRQRPRARQL
jgi:hypothetical protein